MHKINHLLLVALFATLAAVQTNAQQFFFSSEKPGTCSSSDGLITLVPTRGVPPFTYLWSTGATEVSIKGQPKGVYAATLTDASGATITHSYIMNSKEFDLNLSDALPVGYCNPTSGSLTVAPAGGIAPFSYSWSNGQTGATAQGLAVGNYSVTVQDASGCTAAGEYEVKQVSGNYYPNAHMDALNKPDCTNTTDGSLLAHMQNSGYEPYTYLWSTGATNSTVNNLGTGTYSVTITDALGCSSSASLILNKKLTTAGSIICTGASNSGTVSAVLENATAPVNYSWSNGQTGTMLNSLPGGTYNVTATDANGCSSTESVNVTNPVLNINNNSQKCFSGNNGSASVYVSNDQGVSFLWDNGVTDSWNQSLSVGLHTVTVTTALGCALTGSINIAAPLAPAISIGHTETAADCLNGLGGSINLTITGGLPPYSYNVYGPSGFISSNVSSLQNLAGGEYYVQANTSNFACYSSESITVPESNGFNPKLVVDQLDCSTGYGSAAVINVTVPGATYQWGHGATNPALFNLTAGCYNITVSAGGSCTQYYQFCLYSDDSLQVNGCVSGVSGMLFNDLGVAGCAGTAGIPYQVIRTQPSGAINFTNGSGAFNVNLPTGTFDLDLPQYDPFDIACPLTGKHTVNSVLGTNIFGLDFHFLNTNNIDHRVRQKPLRTAQPGFPYSVRLEVCNDGIGVNPGTLDLDYGNFLGAVTGHYFAQHPSAFVFNSESAGVPNNAANFTFPGIAAGACEVLQLDLETPSATPVNTAFLTSAAVSPASGDPTPSNNLSTLYSTVVGSFDPNSVFAFPARDGNPKDGGSIIRYQDNTITYQIFFQNTGNAPADLVIVKDTIDSHLNLASIRNISSSHDMTITTESGNDQVLVFKFNNINLPDSTTDYASSIGSIQYEIDLKPGIQLGAKIQNRAAIFFDFNSPVITNQNTLELVSASKTRQPALSASLVTFPNPADSYVGIYCEEAAQVRLYSAMGALLSTHQFDGGLHQIDTAHLPNGIYMVSMMVNGKTRTGKVVVQH